MFFNQRLLPAWTLLSVVFSSGLEAAVQINPAALITSEGRGSVTYQVMLDVAPASGEIVTLTPVVEDGTELSVSGPLVFNIDNYQTAQLVSVTPLMDNIIDGSVLSNIHHQVSVNLAGGVYENTTAPDITVNNEDVDGAALIVQPASGSSLFLSEGTAQTVTFSVGARRPNSDILFNLNQSNLQGNTSELVVSLNAANNFMQTVEVMAVHDGVVDGDLPFTIVTDAVISTDLSYSGINPVDIQGLAIDSKIETSVAVYPSLIRIVEGGKPASYQVELKGTPLPDEVVTITAVSNDVSEATVSTPVQFNESNFNQPQVISVTPVSDGGNDGDVQSTITLITSSNLANGHYSNIKERSVSFVNINTDGVRMIAVEPSASAELMLKEGQTKTINVSTAGLRPLGEVSFAITGDNAQGVISKSQIVLNQDNDFKDSYELTALHDGVIDGDQTFKVIASSTQSTDSGYSGQTPLTVNLLAIDNAIEAGVVLSPAVLQSIEGAGFVSYQVYLEKAPANDEVVTLMPASEDTTEATVSGALVFNASNFSVPQLVTITPIKDNVVDNDQTLNITHNVSSSLTDGNYSGYRAGHVTLTNRNIDNAQLVAIHPALGAELFINEGSSQIITINVPGTKPKADIVVDFTGTSEQISLSENTVLLNESNQFTATLALSAVIDQVIDGDQVVSIISSQTRSDDPAYNGIKPVDISAVAIDVDPVTPGQLSFQLTQDTVNENASTVNLLVERTGSTIGEASAELVFTNQSVTQQDYSSPKALITFANGESRQTVSLIIVDDLNVEETESLIVSLRNPVNASLGTNHSSQVFITDNDTKVSSGATSNSSGGGGGMDWMFCMFLVIGRYLIYRLRYTQPCS